MASKSPLPLLLLAIERSRAWSGSSCFTFISSIAQGRKFDQEGKVGRLERFKGMGQRGVLLYCLLKLLKLF